MKRIDVLLIIGSAVLISSCKTTPTEETIPEPIPITVQPVHPYFSKPVNMICSIDILQKTVTKSENVTGSIKGSILDESREPMSKITMFIDSIEIGAETNNKGEYTFDNIAPGMHVLRFKALGAENCWLSINLEAGDQVDIDAIVYVHRPNELLKPIIYIYPEEKIDVEVELTYDGKITTTYPKLPPEGWKVTAFPDGTLIDENNKEYYALYWEGEPRESLEIEDGFVVSNEHTIPFLEEKLAQLGLNPKESNEFIIFWLPILEKNNFNLIHFAGDDYLEQAQLSISPTPETVIRITMVFQGLDEEITFPIQDLEPLTKTRSGFTVVEWGGQQLPKSYKLKI